MVQGQQPQSWIQRLLKIEPGVSLYQWTVDRISNNWPTILLLFGGGGGVTYAAITDRVWNLSPLGVVAAVFAGCLVLLLLWLLFEVVSGRRDRNRAVRQLTEGTHSVNVLASEFRDQRIALADFYSAFKIPNKDKLFRNYEMVGPGNLGFSKCHLLPPLEIHTCQFVVVRPDQGFITNVTTFERCTFSSGKFIQCTFFVTPEQLDEIREKSGNKSLEPINYESKGKIIEIKE